MSVDSMARQCSLELAWMVYSNSQPPVFLASDLTNEQLNLNL